MSREPGYDARGEKLESISSDLLFFLDIVIGKMTAFITSMAHVFRSG